MDLPDPAQPEPTSERTGEIELPAGLVGPPVDDLGQNASAAYVDEDPSAAWQRRVRHTLGLAADHTSARGPSAKRSGTARAGQRDI